MTEDLEPVTREIFEMIRAQQPIMTWDGKLDLDGTHKMLAIKLSAVVDAAVAELLEAQIKKARHDEYKKLRRHVKANRDTITLVDIEDLITLNLEATR